MNCPKCSSLSIRRVATISTSSSFERMNDRANAFVEGLSCLVCGYWQDIDVPSKITVAEAIRTTPVPKNTPIWMSFIDAVRPLATNIRRHRSNGMGLEMCARLVRMATKTKIQWKQLDRVMEYLDNEKKRRKAA